jgi:hypothetical protein
LTTITESPITAEMRACIDACTACHHACLETESAYMRPQGRRLEVERFALLADCAEMCETTANFLLSASTRSALLCRTCAEFCDLTARSCDEVDEPAFAACARAARRCAETCRAMI